MWKQWKQQRWVSTYVWLPREAVMSCKKHTVSMFCGAGPSERIMHGLTAAPV